MRRYKGNSYKFLAQRKMKRGGIIANRNNNKIIETKEATYSLLIYVACFEFWDSNILIFDRVVIFFIYILNILNY